MRDKVKRFISILMTALMLVNLLPVGALAEGVMISNSVQSIRELSDGYPVFVFVEVTGNTDGLTMNSDKWFTLGMVKSMDGVTKPPKPVTGYQDTINGVTAKDVTAVMTRYKPNESINLGGITWKGFKSEHGASNTYPAYTNQACWHLDGSIRIEDLQVDYTIRYVDENNKEIASSKKKTDKAGSWTKLEKEDIKDITGYTYTDRHDPMQKLVGGKDTVINVYYTTNSYKYKVEHYYDGEIDPSRTDTIRALYGSTVEEYNLELKPKGGYEHETTVNCPLTITEDESKNVIKVYYTKQTDLSYTVKYLEKDTNKELHTPVTKTGVTFETVITPADEAIGIDGYNYDSADKEKLTIGTGENVLTLYYTKRTDLSYTVNYYWNGTEYPVKPSKPVTGKMFGEEVTESPIGAEGYTPVSTESQTITLGTGTNEINFYYYKNVELTANSRTLTYDGYEHGVSGFTGAPEEADFSTINVGANGTDANTYPANFAEDTVGTFDKTEKYIVTKTTDGQLVIEKRKVTLTSEGGSKVYDGAPLTKPEVQIEGSFVDGEVLGIVAQGTVTDVSEGEVTNTIFFNRGTNFKESNYDIQKNEGKLSITKRNVVLTSETASKPYDGNPLTKPDVTVTGDGFVKGEVSEIKAKGSVTHVSHGKVTNTITYTKGANFKESNYTITKKEGELWITGRTDEVVVEIEGRTKTVTYNGEEHTAWQYDVVSISDPLYETAPGEFPNFWNKNAKKAKGTDAGTYPMGWKAEDFENTNTNFSNVTFVVTDGSLTITKRPVTLTSASDKKVYDGQPLTKKEVTAGTGENEGFVKDQGATYNVTGSQTDVGESDNAFEYTLNNGTNPDNYDITTKFGTLKVTPVTDKVTVTITGLNKTVTYDGEEHSVFGYDATSSNKLYNPKGDMQFEGFDEDMTAKGTDAGTHTMGLTADQFHNKDNGNFTNVTFVVEKDGYVKINPRPVTLTSGSAERVYNGKPLTNETVTVGGDGFAKDEGVTCDFTGSQTDVGSSKNTFTFEANAGTYANNYSFEVAFGTLKVTPFTGEVTVTITEKSGTVTYDGGDHIVSGYKSMTANNPLYDVEDYVDETPTEAWTAKGTDAGEYPVGIVAGDFKNINTNFENVEFVVVDGALTITPAPITLQASSRSKTYDGTPLEADGYGFYEGNLALADDIESVILTGSQTLVGRSESQITEVVTKKDKNPKNYKFTFLPGTLTVTDGTGDDPVKPENVVTKTHLKTDLGYNRGDKVTFTISVTNIYNEQKEVTLEEQPGVTFVDPQGAAIGTKATKTLEPGEKWEIQATYTITSNDILAGVFRNTVTAIFGNKSWKTTDDVTTAELDTTLNVTKTSDVPEGQKAALGQKITYTIKVQNAGNVPYTNVKVEDPLTKLTATIETLPVGETRTFTTEYVVTEADVLKGFVLNTATATGDKIKDPKSDEPKEPNGGDEVETPTFAPITIKPKDVTATYNGAAITGKDVEIASGKLLEGHKLSAAVVGSGVNAGSYELTLDPEKITIVDTNNKDVSEMYARTILPGKLIINKRSVLITSQSATKTYDGSALTRPAVTITGDGFVPGELAKAEATGSITNVGSTPNAIRYTTTGAFNAANYSIALSVGTLTVTEKPKPEPRRTFNLTINYVYQNGKRAAASYNRGGLKNGETFDITSPVIAGYTASETVVSGTIYNRDIKVTVIYTADGVNLDDYGVPLGLGNITMNVGDCFE